MNTNQPVQNAELPETTDDFKDVSNPAEKPLTIDTDNDQSNPKSSTRRSAKQGHIAKSGKAVRKGSLRTSAGVQHTDCNPETLRPDSESSPVVPRPDSESRPTSDLESTAVGKGNPRTSPDVQHSDYNPEILRPNSESSPMGPRPDSESRPTSDIESTAVGKGSPQNSPGVQHTDSNEPTGMPNLFTIEEESSILLEDSPTRRQTSCEPTASPSAIYETTEDSVPHNDSINISSFSSDLDDSTKEVFIPDPLKKYMEIHGNGRN